MKGHPRKKNKESNALSLAVFMVLFFAFLGFLAYYNVPYVGPILRQIAGPFFAEKITAQDIKKNYADSKVKILIVPGHDKNSFGAQYKNIKEAELNAELGNNIFDYLAKESKFETFITRRRDGEYQDWFKNYLENNEQSVREFRKNSQKIMRGALIDGNFTENTTVYHNEASDYDSLKLYAVNKWANNNGVDIVFHVHFNDHPDRNLNQKGEYSGFAIYIPEKQLPNHRSSSDLGQSLKERLEKFFPKSDMPQEKLSNALIEDQELIAVGSNASRDGASVLIEYGYIYEAPLEKKEIRAAYLEELAFQTSIGLKKFFNENSSPQEIETTLLPHIWEIPMKKGMTGEKDVLSLQMALYKDGLYPPEGKNFSDCPISGIFGNCTLSAVVAFQKKYESDILIPEKIKQPTGYVGQKTTAKLNELYGKF